MTTYNEQCIEGATRAQLDYIASCDADALRDCLESMVHHYGNAVGLDEPVTRDERAKLLAADAMLINYARQRLALF
jgi:hypothetical protein